SAKVTLPVRHFFRSRPARLSSAQTEPYSQRYFRAAAQPSLVRQERNIHPDTETSHPPEPTARCPQFESLRTVYLQTCCSQRERRYSTCRGKPERKQSSTKAPDARLTRRRQVAVRLSSEDRYLPQIFRITPSLGNSCDPSLDAIVTLRVCVSTSQATTAKLEWPSVNQ